MLRVSSAWLWDKELVLESQFFLFLRFRKAKDQGIHISFGRLSWNFVMANYFVFLRFGLLKGCQTHPKWTVQAYYRAQNNYTHVILWEQISNYT